MKVLMFGWEFPPHISGGLGTACYGLTQGLARHGVEVIFVIPKAGGYEPKDSTKEIVNASDVEINIREVQHHEHWKNLTMLEVSSLLIPYLAPEEFARLTDFTAHDYTDIWDSIYAKRYEFKGGYTPDLFKEVSRYALVAAHIALSRDFNVIHAHDWLTYPAGIAAKKASGKPLVIHVHATEFDRSGENVNQQVYDIERMGMHEADAVIAVSELTRQVVIERYGVPAEKVFAVHNAVLPAGHDGNFDEKPPFREKLVSFLGRITFQKGPDYFVEAAKLVVQKDPDVRFVMAGSGDMMNKMVRRVAALKMGDRFHFAGFLQGDEVTRLFRYSDAYVMPSVSEPFGISTLEAMRSSVPVIISKQSGVAEVLHHAIKVDFWDVEALADAMYALLHYEGIVKMFQRYGRLEVDNMKWENAGGKVKEIYQRVTS